MEVSIVIPAYNSSKYIAEALDSVLAQSFKAFECIVINNGSIDNTYEIINRYSKIDARIVPINLVENIGMAAAINHGINVAKYNYIARMDSDDVMNPRRLEAQMYYISQNPKIGLIGTLGYYINEKSVKIGKIESDLIEKDKYRSYIENDEPIGLLHPSVLFKKSIFNLVGGYRSEFWPAEDIDLWNRMIEHKCEVIVLPDRLMNYRIYSGANSARNYVNNRKRYEWVRHCMRLRRSNNSEIDWETFVANEISKGFFYNCNKNRKRYAKYFYRNAGVNYGDSNIFLSVLYLCAAVILQPTYSITRAMQQFNFFNK